MDRLVRIFGTFVPSKVTDERHDGRDGVFFLGFARAHLLYAGAPTFF